WLQAAWSIVLILLQTFEQLVDYASAAMLITGTLTVMAVMVLRRNEPAMPRPYRTWGYPWTPLAYAVSSVSVLVWIAIRGLESDAHSRHAHAVGLAVMWFALALLFHRCVVAPRRNRERAPGA